MGNRYRFTLGYQAISSNLVTGVTRIVTPQGDFTEYEWPDVVIPGKNYKLIFEQIGGPGSSWPLGVGVGFGQFNFSTGLNTGFISRWFPVDNGFYTYENICLEGNNLIIVANQRFGGTKDVINVELYEMDWNDSLVNIPVGWDESKLELKRDDQDFAQIEKYSSTLKFVGDGFDYLKQVLLTEGRNAIVPVKIEKLAAWCSPYASNLVFETIFTGTIYLDKAVFDYPNRNVQATLEDLSTGAILSNGKDVDIDVNTFFTDIRHEYYFLGDKFWSTQLHDTIGSYPGNKYRDTFRVFSVFKAIIRGMSEGQVDFRSDFFDSGAYEWLMMTRGDLLYKQLSGTVFDDPITFSFTKLFNDFDKEYNLAIGFEIENNIKYIRIEPKSYFQAFAGERVEFSDVREITTTAPKETNYRILNIGFKNKWDPVLQTNNDNGWVLYYSSKNVADGVVLNLVSEHVVETEYLHYAIEQSVTGESADLDDKIILFECYYVGGAHPVKSTQVTTAEFNHTLHPEDSFNRWKLNLPVELFGGTNTDRIYGEEFRSRLVKFSAPITMKAFNKLINPTAKVRLVNPAKNKVLIDGIAMSVSRSMKTGIAEIEILTS